MINCRVIGRGRSRTWFKSASTPHISAVINLALVAMLHTDVAAGYDTGSTRIVSWSGVSHILPLVPPLIDNVNHKGQHGRVIVVGGSETYTGAPYFAAMAALTMGADIVSVYCALEAAIPIKSYSPELMVSPMYSARQIDKAANAEEVAALGLQAATVVTMAMSRANSVVIGPGLGRSPVAAAILVHVVEEARMKQLPIVVDADALALLTEHLDIVKGYNRCILTPNLNEFRLLSAAIMAAIDSDRCSLDDRNKSSISSCLREFTQLSGMQKPSNEDYVTAVKAVAQFFDGPTIFLKGVRDIVSTAAVSLVVDRGNRVSPRRCGGQGDLLAGSLATTINWATKFDVSYMRRESFEGNVTILNDVIDINNYIKQNPVMLACVLSSAVIGEAAFMSFAKRKRGSLATHILDEVGDALNTLSPVADVM